MSGLPRGWASIALGDVTDPSAPIQYGVLKPGPRTAEGVPMLRVTDIRQNTVNTTDIYPISVELDEEFRRTRLRAGDVLISVQGTVGRVAIVPFVLDGANISRTLARIRSLNPEFSEWIRIALLSPQMQQRIGDDVGGTTRDSLNIGDLRAIALPFPPLSEQRRIVAKVDRLAARTKQARDELDRVQKLIERHRSATLSFAYKAASEISSLIEVGQVIEDCRYGTATKCHNGILGAPVLRIPNVSGGIISTLDLKYAQLSVNDVSKLSLRVGDILVIRSNGSPKLVGVAAKVGSESEGMAFAGYLIRIRTKSSRLVPSYLMQMLRTPQLRNEIERSAKSTSGVHNINSAEIAALRIPLPTIEQQCRIVSSIERAFTTIDRLAAEARFARDALDNLDQAILAKAFRGELVPQGPSDEPASVLLKRIQAERATAGPASKRGRRPRTAAIA